MKSLSLSENQSFSNFKKEFYLRFPDIRLFDCGQYNLIKVILDGLKVNYNHQGVIVYRQFKWYTRLYNYLKFVTLKKAENCVNSKYIFLDNLREVKKNGKEVSFYSDNFESFLRSKEKSISIYKRIRHGVLFHDGIDINYKRYSNDTKETERVKTDCINLLKSLENHFTPDDFKNVRFAVELFYMEFKKWFNELVKTRTKTAFVICHYHNEGFIAAAHSLGIKTIELQHGIISEMDIFYCLPEVIKKTNKDTLFCNEIWVFGEYWKQKLLKGFEYSKEQISVFGFYPVISNDELNWTLKEREFIKSYKNLYLITSQTKMHKDFISAIEKWSQEEGDIFQTIGFLFKLHPNEKLQDYQVLHEFDNILFTPENASLSSLFGIVKGNITSYSTTIYDALKYGVKSYSIVTPHSIDYVSELVVEGLTTEIVSLETLLLDQSNVKADIAHYFSKPLWNKLVRTVK
tara:strand:- start:5419 stop:6798 length:1380 start_codon:yes stop_codon:yes gene_type:complete